jgi:2-dehydro-3-deoxy-D-gluconate 5-dehydrogenase
MTERGASDEATELFSLAGRVALVTGGNSGIGRTLALGLHRAGAAVAIGGRRAERNAAVCRELGEHGAAFALDVADESSVERVIAAVVERFGRIDILVNNAGTASGASVLELERSAWDRELATNLTGAFLCTKHAARRMRKQEAGKIINIASVYGLVAPSGGRLVAYTASKHGLIGLTRVNAVELAPFGIQVNAIAPGYYFTEMNAELKGTRFEDAVVRRTPAGRWGEMGELLGTCLYLAAPASNHVTGTHVVVDGGYLASDGLERGGRRTP